MTNTTSTQPAVTTTVLRTKTQTTETARTANAAYTLDVIRSNGALTSVNARVAYATDGTAPDGTAATSYQDVGTMSWRAGKLTAIDFPLAADTAALVTDFAAIIAYLQSKEEV